MSIARPHRPAAALAVTALALALSGCRLPFSAEARFLEQSPREIAAVAFAEMHELRSVRLLGSTELRGVTTRVDMQLDDQGSCTGTFESADGGMHLRKNEQGTWVKTDQGSWRAVDNGLDRLCDLDGLLAEFTLTDKDTDESLVMGEVEQIGEHEAVPIEGDSGKERTIVWVSLTSPHRVLKMAPADDVLGQQVLFFDDFDADFVVETPARKDVADAPTT